MVEEGKAEHVIEALQEEDTEHTCQLSGFFSHWAGHQAASDQGVRNTVSNG